MTRRPGFRDVYLVDQPTTNPSFHPVCRRPTHRGAGVVHGVQVERATVRTTWTPWAASARLCLGRWQAGWKRPTHATSRPAPAYGAPAISEPERPRRRLVLTLGCCGPAGSNEAPSRRAPAFGVKASVGPCLHRACRPVGPCRLPQGQGLAVSGSWSGSGSVRCVDPWRGQSEKRDHPGASSGGAGPGAGAARAEGGAKPRAPEPRAGPQCGPVVCDQGGGGRRAGWVTAAGWPKAKSLHPGPQPLEDRWPRG
ncbi:hypothetical protein SGRIM119S_01597 [Streptomyces griseorubiginosus]